MKQALEALEEINKLSIGENAICLPAEIDGAMDALRQALETEPLEYWNAVEGWVKIDEVHEHFDAVGCGTIYKSAGEGRSPLYTAPPKREWVSLTADEIWQCNKAKSGSAVEFHICYEHQNVLDFAESIEEKLKEKNT
jgi:hypothetical protein